MPYKSEKIKLKGLQDRRKKLDDKQRETIKELYGTGLYSLNDLAKKYNVSKKTILLIVNKDSEERARQYRKEHWKNWQRGTEERSKAIAKTRKYKQELYVDGKLKDD